MIELGSSRGAHVEILHEGASGRDPIAVRVNQPPSRLRRCAEAMGDDLRPGGGGEGGRIAPA